MPHTVFRTSGKLFLSIFASACVAFISTGAMAQVMTGCDPLVMAALNAKAQAQVAYDVAVIREIVDKPDSVLDLTCFDQAAGVSAKKGGAIFSGDFTTDLSTVMPVTGGGNFNCTAMADLWQKISDEGINNEVPYATFDNLMSGNIPGGAGPDYTLGWDAAKAANMFNNLNAAVAALPPPTVVDFSSAKSSCEVLTIAGIYSGSCP